MKTTKKQIYIVEDNEIYAKQLEFIIKNELDRNCVISIISNGKDLYKKISDSKIPDVIIMDHFLNEKEEFLGFDILLNLKNRYPNILMILHSSKEDIDLAINVVKSNKCIYIAKGKEGFDRITKALFLFFESASKNLEHS